MQVIIERIAVAGAGSWGTALAHILGEKGYTVDFWVRRAELAAQIREDKENKSYLPGVKLSENIFPSTDLEQVIGNKEIIIIAVPSKVVKEIIKRIAPLLSEKAIIVNTAKGLGSEQIALLSQIIATEANLDYQTRVVALSGPNHAEEISRGVPSATVVASPSLQTAEKVQNILMTDRLRVYTNLDLTGVEVGGALKNIIAIGAGICDGLGYGDNTKAALMTRGLIEIARLGTALGAKPLTFSGLSGIGDLFVTCTSKHSRNRRFGISIAKGEIPLDVINNSQMVVEGYTTTKIAYNLASKLKIEMPITTEMYRILYENKSPAKAVETLMKRNKTNEMEDLLTII
ncbi:NAD(P)H-dependent glycerol-3-phosphate dehydrogenase [candidate division NPL-UPA2 bacterium]|nr:NAD(P)H-dependent glycerol-3-phosphate dehydrogenase [candidate division NPL-UPA2 bacterium]